MFLLSTATFMMAKIYQVCLLMCSLLRSGGVSLKHQLEKELAQCLLSNVLLIQVSLDRLIRDL